MDYKVLLLTFLFVVVVEGQTTAVTTPPTQTTRSDQGVSFTKPDQGLLSTKSDQGSSARVTDNDDSTESASTEEGDLKAEPSLNRFTFTEADALSSKKTLPPKPDNDLVVLGEDEDAMKELTMFQKLLSGSDKANDEDDETPDAKITDSKGATDDDDDDNDNDDDKEDNENADDKDDDDKEDDDDEDEEGDGDSDEDEENVPKATYGASDSGLAQKSNQLRRQGDIRPGFGLGSLNREDSRQKQDKPDSPVPIFMPAGEQINAQETSNEGSPVLQLTEGGYQRPYQRFYRFEDPRQNMKSGSASQQSETLEAPRAGGNQAGPLAPQVEYSTPYQPQLGARPVFQPSGGFAANGILPGGLQNGFFNTPPAGFTDFSSANFQTQFHPSDNGGFSAVPRDQGFSLFQTPPRQNGLLFQGAPQYPHPQPMMDSYPRPQNIFHPSGFTNFPDIVDDTTRPNYSPYMRHPAMNQQQFQVNPNFYGTLPISGMNDFNNAGINLQPNYPGNAEKQSFQPQLFRYPLPNNPITLQSSDQVDKQKPDSADPVEDPKSKDSDDGLKASQDKEDPTSVPFGARIRPDTAPGQKDVYLRYPVREAGYATEENLPVQNTTEKTTKNTDPSSNPTFQIFAEEFRPFNPDPFTALHALQRSYMNNRNVDDNSESRAPVDQYARHAPAPFDARPPTHPFPPYQGNQEAPVFQNRPFFPVPSLDNTRNPFYQLTSLPENRYPFSGPGSARNADGSAKIPTCAQDNNSSVCFEDADYPRRELVYALNSNPFLVERLAGPSQIVEQITAEEQNASDDQDSADNYICKSSVKVGLPLRAKNVKGTWKVIVNVEKGTGNTEFVQTVRLETCSAVNQPCSYTQGKTACKQKYNVQLLLSWDPEKGLHNDMYKLPIACACQIQK